MYGLSPQPQVRRHVFTAHKSVKHLRPTFPPHEPMHENDKTQVEHKEQCALYPAPGSTVQLH